MNHIYQEAKRALTALMWNRGRHPDGRPLFKYRFNETEFERCRNIFEAGGTQVLNTPSGRALFLIFLAEWFRRKRNSGAWGWELPLADAGLHYDAHGYGSGTHQINYAQLREALDKSLRFWRRPEPQRDHTKKYLWAVVSEAGFPMGAVGAQTGLKRWIENALSQMFQGVPAQAAVRSQSYRLNVEDLRSTLEPVAIDLVQELFALKQFVLKAGPTASLDALAFLDEHKSNWRENLPVDISGNEIRTLVEETLLAPTSQSKALDARRVLRRKNDRWVPAIRFELAGELPEFYYQQLSETLEGAITARVFLRGDMNESLSRPIAVLEKSKRDGKEVWECRSLSSAASFGTSLSSEITLVVLVGERPQAVIVPRGSAPMSDPVIALTAPNAQDVAPALLEFAPAGSFDTPAETLFLLSEQSEAASVQFSKLETKTELGSVGGTHTLLKFSGEASFNDGGTVMSWRTNQAQVSATELNCLGRTIFGTNPPVFKGVPKVQSLDGGARINLELHRLHWRPKGKRHWVAATTEAVLGEGDLGVVTDGRLEARTRVRVVNENTEFCFENKRGDRQLRIKESLATECGIWAEGKELEVNLDRDGWIVDLNDTRPGCLLRIDLKWDECHLRMSMRDTSLDRSISSTSGQQLTSRPKVDLATLSGLSLWSASPQRLIFEARGKNQNFYCVRSVAGETPLAVFRREAQELLGLFDSPEAHIRLSWLGDGDWSAEVSRYTQDQARQVDWSLAVEQIKNWLRLLDVAELVVVPIRAPDQSCRVETEALSSEKSFRSHLAELSSEGPWILAGTHRDGGTIKPFFVEGGATTLSASLLERTLLNAQREERIEGLLETALTTLGREELSKYIAAAALVCRRHGISATAFDALTIVAEHPDLGIAALANASSPEEIEAVLDLEIDLPFLWVLTPASTWADAFRAKAKLFSNRLVRAGVDDTSAAYRLCLKTLEHICSTHPELVVHTSWAALALRKALPKNAADQLNSLISPFTDRIASLNETDRRQVQNRMVRRRVDGLPPPVLHYERLSIQPLPTNFDPKFDGVIYAPEIVAACATGTLPMTPAASQLCKSARLYDDTYFLEACPAAVFEALRAHQKAAPA